VTEQSVAEDFCSLRGSFNGLERLVILALTGYGQPEDRTRAEAAGFTGHLTKPVPPELLFAALRAHSAER